MGTSLYKVDLGFIVHFLSLCSYVWLLQPLLLVSETAMYQLLSTNAANIHFFFSGPAFDDESHHFGFVSLKKKKKHDSCVK